MGANVLVIICLSLIVTRVASLENRTSTEDENERSKKVLGIFTVVRFPNKVCVGSNSLNGTCYTSEECSSKKGSSQGSCASGFGVCCVFATACGSTISENNTYHTISTFSSTTTNPCTYKICPCSTNICKLRLDLVALDIAGPFTGGPYTATSFTASNPYHDQSWSAGRCIYDSFTITGTTDINTLCGFNTGQHLYIPSLSVCNTITIKINPARTYTRKWTIAVKQIECGNEYARHDCLQYLTGNGGQFNSFNYDTSKGVVPSATSFHLQSQDYDICFRQNRGKCAICFDAALVPVPADLTQTSFGVSGNPHASIQKSGMDTQCTGSDIAAGDDTGSYADYITINNGIIPTAIQSSLTESGGTRFCGLAFNGATDSIATQTVCSFQTPFKWGVFFNNQEIWTAAAIAVIHTTENFDQSGTFGGLGFWMNWWQKDC